MVQRCGCSNQNDHEPCPRRYYLDGVLDTERHLWIADQVICHFAGIPSPSLLKYLLQVDGGAAEWIADQVMTDAQTRWTRRHAI